MMKRGPIRAYRAAVLLLLLGLIALFGLVPRSAKLRTGQSADREIIIPLGVVGGRDIVETSAEVHNPDLYPLSILSATPDCSCTIAKSYPSSIAPKSTVTVPIEINTNHFSNGPFQKHLAVVLQDPQGQQRISVFTFRGEVNRVAQVVALTSALDYSYVHAGRPTSPLTLYIAGPQRLVQQLPHEVSISGSRSARIELEPKPGSAELSVTQIYVQLVVPSSQKQGLLTSSVRIAIAGQPHTDLVIPVTARVVGRLVARPSVLLLTASPGRGSVADLLVGSTDDSIVTIGDLRSDLPIELKTTSQNTSTMTHILVSTKTQYSLSGAPPMHGTITLSTADGSQSLAIPVVIATVPPF